MRILILAITFPRPNNRLTGAWALEQARLLKNDGHDVRVVVPHSWIPGIAAKRSATARRWVECPARFDFEGVDVFYDRVPYYYFGPMRGWTLRNPGLSVRLAWPWLRRRLLAHVRDFKPDVIWAHHAVVTGLMALWLNERTGVPFVTVDHDMDEMADTLRMPARRRVGEAVFTAASSAIAIARNMADAIRETAPRARVATVPHGFDIALGTPRARAAGRVVVFALGGFYPRKNMPLLARACVAVARKYPDADFRIAGGGVEFAAVRKIVVDAGLADRIVLLGPTPHDRAMDEMASADVFTLVGWNEPYGVVYVEAFAHGLPVVCGNDGGINDLIENGVQGITVPPHDESAVAEALARMVADADARRRMGAAALALYKSRLTGKIWASTMRDLFCQAIDSNTSAARTL